MRSGGGLSRVPDLTLKKFTFLKPPFLSCNKQMIQDDTLSEKLWGFKNKCKDTGIMTGLTHHPRILDYLSDNEKGRQAVKIWSLLQMNLYCRIWLICSHKGLANTETQNETDSPTQTQATLDNHKASHILGAALKLTGWRNRVPIGS